VWLKLGRAGRCGRRPRWAAGRRGTPPPRPAPPRSASRRWPRPPATLAGAALGLGDWRRQARPPPGPARRGMMAGPRPSQPGPAGQRDAPLPRSPLPPGTRRAGGGGRGPGAAVAGWRGRGGGGWGRCCWPARCAASAPPCWAWPWPHLCVEQRY
jgi:hypothetical protein